MERFAEHGPESSGGYVAQCFALDYPDRVLGLVLVGAPRSLHGRRAPFADAVQAMQDPVDPNPVRQVLATGHLIVCERPRQVAADIAAFTTQFADHRSTR